ncbi:trehalose operon repressor [Periweissella fabaria]|uniref:Trehalose operon repressor n=1 Tax=Periweissella fabaria TaxID=546157 RepID=A0ABM8Z5I9_9LACO|nr:trehalose operon repressor [Periweissella fabaria]MCM0596577.1 trehalose operon repressor [Periweissella fabaria]CAH0416498.1 HTH-type transcriptional regulator TreR [Periweissella fabaria]
MAGLYKQIYQELKDAILDEKYPAESFLPSESTLATTHNCSRDTIRKALLALEAEGYIQKQRGRGSQVLQHKLRTFPLNGLTSYQEVKTIQQLDTQTHVKTFEIVTVDEHLHKLTGFALNSKIYHIVRVRDINGIPNIIDIDYLAVDLIPGLTATIASQSLYAYIEGQLQLQIGYSEKQITCPLLSSQDRELMTDLPAEENRVIQVESSSYLADTTLFQHTLSKHRPDQFKFEEFARRQSY